MSQQHCPICGVHVKANPRYPQYVCESCVQRACSREGQPLRFANVDLGGGIIATYADSGKEHTGQECYIDGIACYADEARFGGIVVQAIGNAPNNSLKVDAEAGPALNPGENGRALTQTLAQLRKTLI